MLTRDVIGGCIYPLYNNKNRMQPDNIGTCFDPSVDAYSVHLRF